MRRFIKKTMAAVLAAAMVITLAPANSADAAKKPSLKKKASVAVGKTVKLKIKNGNKKAKVTWKSNKTKIAKVAKKTTKGNAAASIKGLKKGSAKITASYKLGKKTTKFTCKLTVTKKVDPAVTTAPATVATATATATTAAKVTTVPGPSNVTAVPATKVPDPTAVPATKGPTKTPGPTATPTSVPGNAGADAYKISDAAKMVIDGAVDNAKDSWEDAIAFDLLTNEYSVRGTKALTAATAKMMYSDNAFYVLVEVKKANAGADDSVNVYFDPDDKAEGDYTANKNAVNLGIGVGKDALSGTNTTGCAGKAVKTADGYIVEAKIPFTKEAKVPEGAEEGAAATLGNFCFDIQINDGKACTINFCDSKKAMEYDKDKDAWNVGDAKVTVDKDTTKMGIVTLLPSMEQATTAFYTDKGADILAAAKLDAGTADVIPADKYYPFNAKSMTFVDTKFWEDTYKDNNSASIYFANSNIPGYKGNIEKVTLADKDEAGTALVPDTARKYAQAYTIWDKNHIYVLFDVNDPDIAPASTSHYDTDSVEFFLDEDFSHKDAYAAYTDGMTDEEKAVLEDAVQVRVDAIDNAFSTNDAGTGRLKNVGHAVDFKKDAEGNVVGYQAEFIIELNAEHKSGDTMGMDLQINDCFTVPGTEASTDADGNEVAATAATPDRAATLTAYDTTNNAYQYPNVFGRIKLFDKNAAVVDDPVATTAPTEVPVNGTAMKTDTAIVADGDIEAAWDAVEYKDFENYSAEKGATTAQGKVMWDEDNLYALVKVTDSTIDATGKSDYLRDGGDIFLDEDNSREVAYADNTDAFQYRLSGFTQDAETKAWADATTKAFQSNKGTDYTGLVSAYKVTTDEAGAVTGYVMEYMIPFKTEAKAGKIMGFDLSAFDCTDAARANEIQMFGPARDNLWKDASIFSTIKLVEPSKGTAIDLSKARFDNSCGTYDAASKSIKTIGLDAEDTAGTVIYIPTGFDIPVDTDVEITIKGTSWGSADFRVWTTPIDGQTSGDYVTNNQLYLNPGVAQGAAFEKTITLTTKTKACGSLTLKPSHGTNVKGLVITDIIVNVVAK